MRPMVRLRYFELIAGLLFPVCIGSTIGAGYFLVTGVFYDAPWSGFFWALMTAAVTKILLKICHMYRWRAIQAAKLARVYREHKN